MRGFIITLLLWLFAWQTCVADQIVTREADIIDCKVTAIDESTVKYRKPDEKFDREINRGDVFKIRYDNGEEEIFTGNTAVTSASQPTSQSRSGAQYQNTETHPDWNSFPPASRPYHIGDWYSENGVEGIVIWTTPDGRHGRILNKRKFNTSKFRMPDAFFTGSIDIPLGIGDMTNGYANMIALNRFIADNPQYTSDMFPIRQILASLGNGWYLPSIKELEYFQQLRDTYVTYTGENLKFEGKTVKWSKIINHVSKSHGGEKHDDYYRLSSTEVYAPGGASATFQSLYGDPQLPQFALLKFTSEESPRTKAFVRTKGLPFYAFHLF